MGHSQPFFYSFCLFYPVNLIQLMVIKIDWIQNTDLWWQKQLLYQLHTTTALTIRVWIQLKSKIPILKKLFGNSANKRQKKSSNSISEYFTARALSINVKFRLKLFRNMKSVFYHKNCHDLIAKYFDQNFISLFRFFKNTDFFKGTKWKILKTKKQWKLSKMSEQVVIGNLIYIEQ